MNRDSLENPDKGGIIIVDDRISNLRLLSDILTNEGISVRLAIDGKKALQFIGEELPSLILLDVLMPDMDGFEVCRKLKANENTMNIPIIFISSLNDELSKLTGFSLGAVDFITKPFHKEEVLVRVKTHLRLFQLQNELGAKNKKLEEEIIRREQAELILEKRMNALTKPLLNSDAVNFEELFSISEIQKLQDQFADAFGVASLITQTDGTPITRPSNFSHLCQNIIRGSEKGLKNCVNSDFTIGRYNQTGPVVQQCLSCGLWDAAANITVNGHHLANWLIGQVRNEVQEEDQMRAYAHEIGADEEEFMKAFGKVTRMSQHQFQKVAEIIHTVAGQLSHMAFQNVQQARFIHERRIAEEDLLESEERNNAFFSANVDMTFVKDDHFRYIMANDAMAAFFGKPKNELINKTDLELADLSHIYPCQSSDQIALSAGKTYIIEEKLGGRIYETTKFPLTLKGDKKGIGGIIREITDRKNAEEALKEGEEKFRTLIESSNDGISLLDLDGNIQFVNRRKAELLRYPAPADLQGLNAYDLLTPSYQQVLNDLTDQFNENGYLRNFEAEVVRFDNSHFWAEFNLTLVKDSHGNPSFIMDSMHDITDRKDAVETIKSERRLLRTLIDNLPDAIYVKDVEGRKMVANMADVENIGFSKEEEVLGKTDHELFEKEIGQRGYDDDLKVIRTGVAVINREESFFSKDGLLRWLLTSKLPLFDHEGNTIGLVGVGRDITAQKKATETIQKLSKGIEQNPSTIVITDINGNIEYTNPKFTELTGYTKEEAIGENPRILKSGEMSEDNYSDLWKTISSGEVWRGEFHNRRKNGELFWESATITSIKNEEGVITNYIAIKEDISERKQMERDLIAAKELAEENDRLKSAFLANMSHEIRTPLNSIIGFSDLLSDPEFDSDQRLEFIKLITLSGKNLLTTINDIMDISMIEAGQVQVRKCVFSALNLIVEIQKEYRIKAQEKGIILRIDPVIQPFSYIIESDKNKLRQVLVNFVGNAIKFTEKGVIDIGLTGNGNSVQFYVKDTGIGIPTKFHQHIFERFRQVEGSSTRNYGGNGLGLAISKSLIEMLGGTIGIDSKQGEGSKFYFNLPFELKEMA